MSSMVLNLDINKCGRMPAVKCPKRRNVVWFGGGSEFGTVNRLSFFGLLPPGSETDIQKAKNAFGFTYPAPSDQKHPFRFVGFLPGLRTALDPHNQQAEGSSPSGPTTLLIFLGFL